MEGEPISRVFFFIDFIFSFFDIQGVNITYRDKYPQKHGLYKKPSKNSQRYINVFVLDSINKKWGSATYFGPD